MDYPHVLTPSDEEYSLIMRAIAWLCDEPNCKIGDDEVYIIANKAHVLSAIKNEITVWDIDYFKRSMSFRHEND